MEKKTKDVISSDHAFIEVVKGCMSYLSFSSQNFIIFNFYLKKNVFCRFIFLIANIDKTRHFLCCSDKSLKCKAVIRT